MKNNFYAIKVGRNVKDKIVETWEECQKYVIGYPAVYHGFKDKSEAKKYLKNMSEDKVKAQLAEAEVQRFNRLKRKLQFDYGFTIPDYIVDEIINNDNYENLCSLLNLAVLNKRISKKHARIIKEKELKKKNMIQ